MALGVFLSYGLKIIYLTDYNKSNAMEYYLVLKKLPVESPKVQT